MQYENTYLKPLTKNGVDKVHSDELDVIALIQNGYSFFKRYKFIFVGLAIAGLTTGLYFYFSSLKQYSTRLIAHSMFLSNQEEIQIIDNWEKLLSKRESNQLADLMNCNVSTIKKLSNISAEEILKVYASDNPNGFIIDVSVTDVSVLDALQKAIVYGLNNSPYVKERIAVRKTKDMELIKKTTEEIEKLNASKILINDLIQTGHTGTTPVILDVSGISAEIITLNEKLLFYQEDLRFLSGVQVLENFTKGNLERHGLAKFSFLGLATGLFIGYLISLFLSVLKKMKLNTT